jgi:hypothetical protein
MSFVHSYVHLCHLYQMHFVFDVPAPYVNVHRVEVAFVM